MTETLIDRIMKTSNDPDIHDLLEQLTTAARKDAVKDICIDLADFGETEAVEIIKANY